MKKSMQTPDLKNYHKLITVRYYFKDTVNEFAYILTGNRNAIILDENHYSHSGLSKEGYEQVISQLKEYLPSILIQKRGARR